MSEMKNVLIKSIGEVQEFGANGFKVVKFIVVDDSSSEYEQTLELQWLCWIKQGRFKRRGRRFAILINN